MNHKDLKNIHLLITQQIKNMHNDFHLLFNSFVLLRKLPLLLQGSSTTPISCTSAPINCRLNVVVRSPTPFGLGRNGCWSSRGSQLPRVLPYIFLLCCPLNHHRRTASTKSVARFHFFLSLPNSCPSSSPHSSSSSDER